MRRACPFDHRGVTWGVYECPLDHTLIIYQRAQISHDFPPSEADEQVDGDDAEELEVTGEGTSGGPFGLKKVLFVRKKSDKGPAVKEEVRVFSRRSYHPACSLFQTNCREKVGQDRVGAMVH